MTNEIRTRKLKQALGLLRKRTLEETVNMEDFEDILGGVIDDFKFERHTIDGKILDDKGILLAMYAFKEMSAFNGKEIYHATYNIYYCIDSRGRIFRILGSKEGYYMRFGRDNVEKISEDQFLNEIKDPYVNKRRGIIKRSQYLVDNLGDGYFLMVDDDNLVDTYSLEDSEDLRFKTAYRNILKILKKRASILRELEEGDHLLYDVKTKVKVVAKPLGKPKMISVSEDIGKLTDERLRRARPSKDANAYQVLECNEKQFNSDGWYIDWIVQYYTVKRFGKKKH